MAYIAKTIRNYEYSDNDFKIYDNSGVITLVWNPEFSVPEPSQQDLDNITNEEIESQRCRKYCSCVIDIVDDLEMIMCPIPGSLVYHNNKLHIYINDGWQML